VRKSKKITTTDVREKVAEVLDLPADIMGDVPIITVTGNSDIKIEAYRGIIEYSDICIRLNTAHFMLRITGKNLELKSVAIEYIHIKGQISGVEFII